jgi:phytoene dehydrogenase-like protein
MAGEIKKDYDAVVVGSGPNGFAAAITLQREGLSVLLLEGKEETGGGLRSAALTLPGFVHDTCSAIHAMAAGSPFFSTLPLETHGLEYIFPAISAAHPFSDGKAAILSAGLDETARGLGEDGEAYRRLMDPVMKDWPVLAPLLLGPLHISRHFVQQARFGSVGLLPSTLVAKRFRTREARGLWAGMAAHSILPLSDLATSAFALVLLAMNHAVGWPFVRGGSGKLGDALASYFISLGGKIETGRMVRSLSQLPSARALLLDVGARQLLQLGGHKWSTLYRRQLEKYRYGMGVFKIDWALDAPIPFTSPGCRQAGTVHLGGTLEEIEASESLSHGGGYPEKPFVLLTQPSLFDDSRAPAGKHTAWAYCHVPNGSVKDCTQTIEDHVESYAPGFKERILGRHVMNTVQLEEYNPNYAGGDINGGEIDIRQLFTRPALRLSPYRTSEKGIYICSASTPPGGGAHGMCGYHAARRALRDVF